MRLAISAQERPARNALTVVVSYVNPTRKPVVDAARSSAHPVYRCIKACTRKEPQRTTAKISLAKAHSCAGVVRVLFMDRKERGLTGVRMRPARRVHRVLLDRACDGGELIIGVAADQTNRADNEYQDHCQHHGVFRNVLALFVLPKVQGEVKHYTPFLAGVFSVSRESG